MTNLDFFLDSDHLFGEPSGEPCGEPFGEPLGAIAARSLELLALEPIALFEQYEPINDAPAPPTPEDAYENLYLVPI